MRVPGCFLTFALLFASFQLTAQVSNPLLVHSNQPIPFNKVDVKVIRDAVAKVTSTSDQRVKKISSISAAGRTTANTLMAFDELQYDVVDLAMKLGLVAGTYTSEDSRNSANEGLEALTQYLSNLLLNEKLYASMKQFEKSTAAKTLDQTQRKFLTETIQAFERNGMKLDAEGKRKLEAINSKLIALGVSFEKNIAESKDSVFFSDSVLSGISNDTKSGWKQSGLGYWIVVNGPNYTEIETHADLENTRKIFYENYQNRAYPINIKVLDSLFYYRQAFASLLGNRSYAAYALEDKMAGSPEAVWNFERDLQTRLTPNVTKELATLLNIKTSGDQKGVDTVRAWDIAYLNRKLLDDKYQLNTDEVREYFEMNNTLRGMFGVYEKLLSIQIKETKGVPVWFGKVRSFDMLKDGKKIGSFYLDLYPRKDKYTHFACFPISQYRKAAGTEVLPVAALICNFPEGNSSKPSLLNHTDVVTLFHEFGHLVADMLGRSNVASLGPFSVKGDFGEAPSQFLENWVWEYEPLKTFARHYKTGKVLPESLFAKMKASQLAGISIQYIRQVFLGQVDFTFEDRYDSIRGKDLNDVSKDLYAMTQIPWPEGTHQICSFVHLSSYAANYYGYLWSKVFAQDMFSVFQKNGIMDVQTGLKYRKEILEKAASMPEMQMLENFLGRKPNATAFLQSLGLAK